MASTRSLAPCALDHSGPSPRGGLAQPGAKEAELQDSPREAGGTQREHSCYSLPKEPTGRPKFCVHQAHVVALTFTAVARHLKQKNMCWQGECTAHSLC